MESLPMKTFKHYILLSFLALSIAMPVKQSSAGENESKKNIMFIFDASGSMWGQIDGKHKISIAKMPLTTIF